VKLLWKNLLFTLFVPGAVCVYIPLSLVPDRAVTSNWFLLAAGLMLLGLGGGLYAWCVWDFASFGRGTPLPLDAPKKLVVRGLYRVSRNPMYLGVLGVILGWAALFAAGALLAYLAAVGLCCHLFVVCYEEPRLRQLFGAEYVGYCSRVPRWLPRLTAVENR
jgi:protein-S-isoprenylcysteine O-methyltransferase Ste14